MALPTIPFEDVLTFGIGRLLTITVSLLVLIHTPSDDEIDSWPYPVEVGCF